jgi:hypothetical protein
MTFFEVYIGWVKMSNRFFQPGGYRQMCVDVFVLAIGTISTQKNEYLYDRPPQKAKTCNGHGESSADPW